MRVIKCLKSKNKNCAVCNHWTGTTSGSQVCHFAGTLYCYYSFNLWNFIKAIFDFRIYTKQKISRKSNMIKIEEPDSYIRIGISNQKIVSVEWDNDVIFPGFVKALLATDSETNKIINKHLKKAIKFIKNN